MKVTSKALNYFKTTAENPSDYNFMTGYGLDIEEGKMYNAKIKEEFKRDDIILIQIGATIGVHTGPNPLGLGFIKQYEKLR